MFSGKHVTSVIAVALFIFAFAFQAVAQEPNLDAPVVADPNGDLHLNPHHEVTKDGVPAYKTVVEDWSNLHVGKSQLTPREPVFGMTGGTDDFTRTLMQVQWRPGDPIDLYIVLPKNVKNPPAVIYLYGHDEDTDRFKDDRWCARVTSGGVAAIGFVSALSGQRFHDRPMKQTFVSELQESIGSTVHDVKFILDYLAQRGEVDMSRIGMFGQGSGGTIAILAAVADPRVKVVDALDPWGYWPGWVAKSSVVADDPNKADYQKPAFLRKVAPLDPVKWLPQLKTAKLRVMQPMDAAPVPRICKNQIKLAMPKSAELKRFDTVTEMMSENGGGVLFMWVKDHVKGLPPGNAVAETKPAPKSAE